MNEKDARVIAAALKDLGTVHQKNTREFGERVKGVEVKVDSLETVFKDGIKRVSTVVDKVATVQADCPARGGWSGVKERVEKIEDKADRREEITGVTNVPRGDSQVVLKESEVKKIIKIVGWIIGGVAGGAALSELIKGVF
jgi:hypothetical protein